MARRCDITGKRPMSGYKVSHAMNHTKRRFLPNLQNVSVWSDSLSRSIKLRMSTSAIRTIEHKGGFDAWILNEKKPNLTPELLKIRKAVETAQA